MKNSATVNAEPAVSVAQPANAKPKAKQLAQLPRGQPKSQRFWKTPKQKFSSIKKSEPRSSLEQKLALRQELRYIKERSREIKAARKQAAIDKNQRRVENAERRLANERRSEVVQVIKNSAKLKRMRKKQLRLVEKRDLSKLKVV